MGLATHAVNHYMISRQYSGLRLFQLLYFFSGESCLQVIDYIMWC